MGTKVSVGCTTVEDVQNVNFRWFKNGRQLIGSERDARIRLRTFPDVSTLVIGPLEESDSGNYTCTGTAGLKSDSYTQTLHVLISPRWIHEPSDVSVREGDNVTVTCSASGRPPILSAVIAIRASLLSSRRQRTGAGEQLKRR